MIRRTVKIEFAFNGADDDEILKALVEEAIEQICCDYAIGFIDDRYSVDIRWEDDE